MDERGTSLRALAKAVHHDPSYVSKALRGIKPCGPALARAIDDALSAGGEIIHAASAATGSAIARAETRSKVPAAPVLSEDDSPALAASKASAGDVIDVLARIQKFHRGTIHPEVVRQLECNTDRTVDEYESLDHSALAPALRKQRAWVGELVDECSHPVQLQQLLKIAGVTSGVLGYVAVGRGDFPMARAYCLEAFQLGDFTGNPGIKAWARGLQSFCEYYAGDYGKALELATDGLSHAQSGPQSVRLAINGVARAKGKLGDADGVRRAVEDAYELMSRNDVPGGVPSSISLHCYSEAQTASNAATAYVSLAMPEQARDYASLALPAISASDSPWSRSPVLIDLALSQVRASDGDLEEATRLVLSALAISAGRPVISVRQRASEFARDAIIRWGATPQASAILDALSSTSGHPGHDD